MRPLAAALIAPLALTLAGDPGPPDDLRWDPPDGARLTLEHALGFDFELGEVELTVFDREVDPEELVPDLDLGALSGRGQLALTTVDSHLRLGPERPPRGPLEFVRRMGPLRLGGSPVEPLPQGQALRFVRDGDRWRRLLLDGVDDFEGEPDEALRFLAEDLGYRWSIADGDAEVDDEWYVELTPQQVLDLLLGAVEYGELEALVGTLGNGEAMLDWIAAALPPTVAALAEDGFLDCTFLERSTTADGRELGHVSLRMDHAARADIESVVRAALGPNWSSDRYRPALAATVDIEVASTGTLAWDLERHVLADLAMRTEVDLELRIDFDAQTDGFAVQSHFEASWRGEFDRTITGTIE